jgi:hypothetical protein
VTEKSTTKTVQSHPDVERFGHVARLLRSKFLKSNGVATQLSHQREPKQEGKRREEGKMDHAREDNAEWAEKKLPLNEAFLDFLYQVSGCRYRVILATFCDTSAVSKFKKKIMSYYYSPGAARHEKAAGLL